MPSVNNTNRIAKNTLMLYFRQILIMLVSLYTVRVVLNVLGAEDYGIYNVVAGVVTMFSFLSGAMATASQRYFSFDLGKSDNEHLKTTFSVTFQIYILLAAVLIILAETIGVWFVNNKLVIPAERMTAANWIFQAAIVSFLLTLITTPYMASIIAHENMNVYAYVSIIEASLKLGIIYLLKILPYDKLILYGLLLATVAFINTSIYRLYCHKHYEECKFRFVKDGVLFKEIVSYSGWNLFGASVGVFKNQMVNILLNQFFSLILITSRGIASQVNAAIDSFSNNFCTALKPQIVKKYASEQKEQAVRFTFYGCKYTFYLMWVFVLPLILEMEPILSLWLKNTPEYAVLFTRLALIDGLITSISTPIMSLCQATGKIKLYQGIVGGILLLNFPVSWIVLHIGSPAWGVFVVAIIISFIALFARVLIVRNIVKFNIFQFLSSVIMPCLFVVLVSAFLSITFFNFIKSEKLIFSFFKIIIDVLLIAISIFAIGIDKNERAFIYKMLQKRFRNGERKC